MNTEQLKLLRDAAKLIETDRSWSAINRFTTLANPQDIVELCDELLALRAGNSKTPSIKPSKQALENLLFYEKITFHFFNADVLIPSCDKIKNGYAIRYSGFTYDENSEGPEEGQLWTEQERYIHQAREEGSLPELIKMLEQEAFIPTWRLTVEVGKLLGDDGSQSRTRYMLGILSLLT